ncbi:hypothetical protein [Psychrobacter sp. TWR1-1-1]|uniref:hypothetical protein n=1 Tax=unclassified Psychrobacter TaxID=196806 RepID=UPI003CF7F3CD
MSNQPTDNDNIKNALESLENTTEAPSNNEVTGVEVLKGDKVIYEDGDFEDYNAEKQIESDKEGKSAKEDESSEKDESSEDDKSEKNDKYGATIANIYQWASKLKDDFISDKDGKSDSDEKETSDKDDKHSATIGHIYQWASKLKDDFTSEASNITHEVSEKALAMMLNRLVDGVEAELKAFDKKVEDSKDSVPNLAEERSKISDKKDKYQSMLDLLQS